ncbi:MAG TPA: alpha-amylase family glycosyl hydrolase [Anaerolineae bacterium]|nr:alpha-amylase family glycosyl hydrolase [Anaerolineae bacterium]
MATKQFWWRLSSSFALIITLLLALGHTHTPTAHADEIPITLDGVRDAAYTQIASDPAGDLASPGPADWSGVAWTDMTALYVAADAANLYVYVDAPAYNNTDSTGQIGLAIDTDGQANAGGTGDPWGNAITFDYNNVDGTPSASTRLPDFLIRGNTSQDGGWTELRTWNGNWDTGSGANWGGIDGGEIGTNIAYSFGNGIEFAIPLADIGSPDPAHVHLQFFATQGGGGKGAYDTVPSDDQSTGWDDATTQANFASVPLAIDPLGDLASPGPADWNGTTWTDVSRLHIWADINALHLFIPMAEYDHTVSQGQIIVPIDINSTPAGGTSDAWGNAVTFAYTATHQNLGQTPTTVPTTLPDYLIRGNIFGDGHNGWTEFRTWNGNWDTGGGADWGGIGDTGSGSTPTSNIAWNTGEGLRIHIPYTDINAAPGDTLNIQFIGTQAGGVKGAYDTVPSDDQSTGWDDATTQHYFASYTIPAVAPPPSDDGSCASGATADNNIWWGDLGHNSRDALYRTPGGPVVPDTTVMLRLRAACDDLTDAKIRIWNDLINASLLVDMTKVASDEQYDWWEAAVPVGSDPTIHWYRFIAMDGTTQAFYEDDTKNDGAWGTTYAQSPDRGWQLTVYDSAYQTPDWAKNAIMYQIFPDRFRDGDPSNNPAPGRFFYDELQGTIYRSDPNYGAANPWNTAVCDPRDETDCPGTYSLNFYGGDLQGINDKLDYLQDLGVTALYLNPIFESPSNHKYDTGDYSIIDGDFGDLAAFQALATAAHDRGMKIILDGVFNHTSSDSFYFDRYSRYDAAGNETSTDIGTNDGSGACESPASPFRDWYYFTDVTPGTGSCTGSDGTPNAANYESWFGYDSLPKLNAQHPEVRDLIWSGSDWAAGNDGLARYWMQWADGWRLDVGADVDPGLTHEDPNNPNDYWEGFRAAVRATNPDAYIVIEEWGNASSFMLGAEMDATMNYQYSSAIMSFWRDTPFIDNDHNSGSSAGILAPLTPSELDGRLQNWQERYPPEAYYAMMNLLGSHDTNRPLFMLDHNAAVTSDDAQLLDPNYDWSDAIERLKGVIILQMTLPGAPTIYYGDEIGLVGPVYHDGGTWQDDPYNRQPFPWLDDPTNHDGQPFYTFLQSQTNQDNLRNYYKQLTSARNNHPALRTGSFDTLLVDDDNMVYAFGRKMADDSDAALVIVNRAGTMASPTAQDVTLDLSGYIAYGAVFTDTLSGNIHTVAADGTLTVNVPGQSGVVLVLDSILPVAPTAVTDLAVTAERSQELDLAWSAATGATSYDLYRSLVSGGGYQWVANVAGTSYTDTGLTNAQTYYYVVVSRDDATGLASAYSNEAWGTPQHDLTAAWYNLQWPYEITHTISTITPTENVYGQLWIDGATGPTGPATGITAQLGYGWAGTLPQDGGWYWLDMPYFNADGNNDQFAATMLPTMLGEYNYTTRYSSDGGNSWYYADSAGPYSDPANLGLLHVISSTDITPPAAPLNLTLDGTTPSSIHFSWDPVADLDLAGYEIYRQISNPASGFILIDTVDAATTSYIDNNVTTGETYDYYILAFDTSYNRSANSNTITATAEARMVNVTFRVGVPWYTPGTVYVTGDAAELGPWNPGANPMTEVEPGIWEASFSIMDGTAIQYKYTRGNWNTVESWGGIVGLSNRSTTVNFGVNGNQIIDNTTTDWGVGDDSDQAVQYWRDPIVINHEPAAGAIDVPVDTHITTTWSISLNIDSTYQVTGPDGPVSGTFTYDNNSWQLTFTPAAPLAPMTTYTVTVDAVVSPGVTGAETGTQQIPAIWTFTTEGVVTSVALTNLSGTPPTNMVLATLLTLLTLLGSTIIWRRRHS